MATVGWIARLFAVAFRVAAFAMARFRQICELIGESSSTLADTFRRQRVPEKVAANDADEAKPGQALESAIQLDLLGSDESPEVRGTDIVGERLAAQPEHDLEDLVLRLEAVAPFRLLAHDVSLAFLR